MLHHAKNPFVFLETSALNPPAQITILPSSIREYHSPLAPRGTPHPPAFSRARVNVRGKPQSPATAPPPAPAPTAPPHPSALSFKKCSANSRFVSQISRPQAPTPHRRQQREAPSLPGLRIQRQIRKRNIQFPPVPALCTVNEYPHVGTSNEFFSGITSRRRGFPVSVSSVISTTDRRCCRIRKRARGIENRPPPLPRLPARCVTPITVIPCRYVNFQQRLHRPPDHRRLVRRIEVPQNAGSGSRISIPTVFDVPPRSSASASTLAAKMISPDHQLHAQTAPPTSACDTPATYPQETAQTENPPSLPPRQSPSAAAASHHHPPSHKSPSPPAAHPLRAACTSPASFSHLSRQNGSGGNRDRTDRRAARCAVSKDSPHPRSPTSKLNRPRGNKGKYRSPPAT